MSTRWKISVAAGIVAALIGLILWDKSRTEGIAAGGETTEFGVDPTVTTTLESTLRDAARAIDQTFQQVGGATANPVPPGPSVAPPPAPAGTPASAAPPPTAPAAPEVYEVRAGDRLFNIAERKYGDGNFWKLITDANPGLDPDTLRVGTKLVIPPKPPSDGFVATTASFPSGGPRTYVIQPGDTLSHLSVRFFKTGRHARKIFEANAGSISDPDNLVVGARIVLPEMPAPAPQTAVVTPGDLPAAPSPDTDRRTYRVKSGDSLWKIAKSTANGGDIYEAMERIRHANPEKIRSFDVPLRVDWVLALPE